ncbi:MAG: peptidoglycan editing factor PgeF [Dermatophilaceae bacterium]
MTDRQGGVSAPPRDALNLAGHVGDEPSAVETNRGRLADALGLEPSRVVYMNQCHGDTVHVVDGPWTSAVPAGDAVVTAASELALTVLVADCVPVLLSDSGAGVVAAVHAGRAGLLAGIVHRALDAMADLGAHHVDAVVGPSVCGRCYEVPEPMRAQASDAVPLAATVSWTGSPALDIAAGVVGQLAERGVRPTWLPGCTRENAGLFSYRREAATGRFAGVILRYAAGSPALAR